MTLADRILELARIPAPTFAEEPRIAWLERRLAGAPGRRDRDEAGNLVWAWGDGRPRVLVLAHVDTVFPPSTELSFQRDGDALVGPGIGDNAAAVAVVVDVVSELLQNRAAAGAVAFTVGEEGLGNLRGARAACSALEPECVIAVEGHGLDQVIVDCVGSLRVGVRVRGPGGHSWVDRGTPSAIHALLELGAGLAARATAARPVNVGLITGGRSVNAIADQAELALDVRSLDDAELDAFAADLADLGVNPPLRLELDELGRRPAGRLDRADPLLALVREERAALGLPDALADGSTDANAALALGIPALTLGIATGAGMHTLEERIDVRSLELGREQLRRVLDRLLREA